MQKVYILPFRRAGEGLFGDLPVRNVLAPPQGWPSGCGSWTSPWGVVAVDRSGLLPILCSQTLGERNWVQRRQRSWNDASFASVPGNVQRVVLSPVLGSTVDSQAVIRPRTRNRKTGRIIIFVICSRRSAVFARTETTAGLAGRQRSLPGWSSVRQPWRSHRRCSRRGPRPGCSPASRPAS